MLRHFIVAPSLARLIQKERGGESVLEGYFLDRPNQSAYVRVEEHSSSLILILDSPEGPAESRADIPAAHAQALLAVATDQVTYNRVSLAIGSLELELQRFVGPSGLDLISVAAEQDDQVFKPLSWFGPEVSGERAYQRQRMALDGIPARPEVEVTNEALNNLLDILENRPTTWPLPHRASTSEEITINQTISSHPPELAPSSDVNHDADELGLEDNVSPALARSLRPQPH